MTDSIFSLTSDQADDETIDRRLREGAELRGANLWVLMFAILVASVGLNVNSPAVIIGAMLISPLMSPIMAAGYGAAMYDLALISRALRDLVVASAFSVLASALYFSLSPLSEAGSELLARTSPSLWDVLIAAFGGLAGVVAATRKSRSNVLPGVAIATALMPPLCTAGYAIANARWSFFAGAVYLFSINSVFIASSTFLFVRLFNPTHVRLVDKATKTRIVRGVWVAVILTMTPSLFLAYRLVQREVFNARSRSMIDSQFSAGDTRVVERRLDSTARTIEITLVGPLLEKGRLAEIQSRLPSYGLSGAHLVVHQTASPNFDPTELKAGILGDLYDRSSREVADRDQRIRALEVERSRAAGARATWIAVGNELRAQYPEITGLSVAQGVEWKETLSPTPSPATGAPSMEAETAAAATQDAFVVTAHSKRRFSAAERTRLEEWLKVRLQRTDIRLYFR
ncbi:MAG: DUF389 domain-containing protein [Vicinamibacteria bacterium]